jgi:hypothetical protein
MTGQLFARVFVTDETEINCFVLEVRNYNCWNHTMRFAYVTRFWVGQ